MKLSKNFSDKYLEQRNKNYKEKYKVNKNMIYINENINI
jgi:hypothetical protein